MTRDILLPHVERIVAALRPHCEDIAIAGGLRRGKADPHDAEIVCLPKRAPDLFGDGDVICASFNDVLRGAIDSGILAWDTAVKRNGERYKRFVICAICPLDLFIADADNYGNTLAIRTGNAEFSRLLVSPRAHGGLMPDRKRQQGGYLWRSGDKVPCRTEADFFAAIGIPWVEPADRNEATARRIAKGLPR